MEDPLRCVRSRSLVIKLGVDQDVFDGRSNLGHKRDGLQDSGLYKDEVQIAWDYFAFIDDSDRELEGWLARTQVLERPILLRLTQGISREQKVDHLLVSEREINTACRHVVCHCPRHRPPVHERVNRNRTRKGG